MNLAETQTIKQAIEPVIMFISGDFKKQGWKCKQFDNRV